MSICTNPKSTRSTLAFIRDDTEQNNNHRCDKAEQYRVDKKPTARIDDETPISQTQSTHHPHNRADSPSLTEVLINPRKQQNQSQRNRYNIIRNLNLLIETHKDEYQNHQKPRNAFDTGFSARFTGCHTQHLPSCFAYMLQIDMFIIPTSPRSPYDNDLIIALRSLLTTIKSGFIHTLGKN